jgi:hypothetical protein
MPGCLRGAPVFNCHKEIKNMSINDFFQAAVDEAAKRVGGEGRILVKEEDDSTQRGLPSPSLALCYLFHAGIIPFGGLLGIAGKKASMKSAFGFGLGALATQAGGGFHLIETEDKLNEHFLYSFFEPEHRNKIHVDYVKTLEEAQSCVTAAINRYRKLCKNEFPLVIGIDSLAGSGTAREMAEMNKKGHAERNFPEAALLWLIWPFMLVTACRNASNCWDVSQR